jgi:Domain of Unknown Function (DUF1080)
MIHRKNSYRMLIGIFILFLPWQVRLSSAKEYPNQVGLLLNSTKHVNTANILFADNFSHDGNLTDSHKWSIISGNWAVERGVLTVANEGDASTEAYILAGDSTWTNYCVTGQVRPDKRSNVDNDAGILLRVNSDQPFGSRYTICLNPYKNWVGCANDRGPKQWIGHGKFHFRPNAWYSFAASVCDSSLEFSINGRLILHCDHLLLTHGKIGLEAWNHGTQKFKDLKVMMIE